MRIDSYLSRSDQYHEGNLSGKARKKFKCALLRATGATQFKTLASVLDLSEATLFKTIRDLTDVRYAYKVKQASIGLALTLLGHTR